MKRKSGAPTLAVFALTLFLSASVMFGIQPMIGKMLLPLVGGTPAGWIVAMAFFQVMLLAGYLMAHLFSTFPARRHGFFYIAALLAGTFFMPLALHRHIGFTATPGAHDVFLLLVSCVAIPFIALSASSSTLQRLFTVTHHGSARDPYFLYAASNLGSFAGLIVYPFAIEPMLTIDQQSQVFFGGYILLMLFAAACLFLADGKEKAPPKKSAGALPPRGRMAEWAGLAFVPSSLLLGVTTFITTDVISAPMIWIVPLALYLLTFVIAFSPKPVVSAKTMHRLHPYAICAGVFLIALLQWFGGWLGVLFYLAVFFVIALSCHLRLASLRPLGDSRHLTAFNLMISLGGAFGGVLNAFIAPYIFNRPFEFPLMLLGSALLHSDFRRKSNVGMAIIAMLALSVLFANLPPQHLGINSVTARTVIMYALLIGCGLALPFYGKNFLKLQPLTLAALAVFMVSQFAVADESEILRVRNFNGIIRLFDQEVKVGDNVYRMRSMRHGSTVHGRQVLDPALAKEPTAYYARLGPLGDIFTAYKPKKIAVIGLGSGVMNCYPAKDREFTFIELDPAVVKIAEEDFTFLSACKSAKPPRVLVGDGRLQLEQMKGEKFDMLVVDAFTSDSIPTHLLTRESFALYLEHLAPGGVLALNISNRYFSLRDTIAATVATVGLKSSFASGVFREKERPFYATNSLWMTVTRPEVSFESLPPRWDEVVPPKDLRPWTDNYTDLFRTLSLFSERENTLMTKAASPLLAVFSIALFVSAAVMFAVQPMAGKMLLPLVGGTPAGWIVAMAFFQIMLLAGYLIAHIFSKFNPFLHGILYLACLLAGAFFLPVVIHAPVSTTPGAFDVLLLLCTSLGVPFVALSMTSSTMQRLFTVTPHAAAKDPYFLYMASNLGSFAGLLLYPFAIEPRLTLSSQAISVSIAYGVLTLLAAICLITAKWSGKEAAPAAADTTPAPAPKLRLFWLALAFVPSSLLMGVTTFITTDVLSAPLVWVLPLGLYLLTFVIAFGKGEVSSRATKLHPYAICTAICFMALVQVPMLTGWLGVLMYLAIFGVVATACHSRLAALRPAGGGRLTEFYLIMAAGGALGGIVNAFIIPHLFSRLVEMPLMLLASFMLHPLFRPKTLEGMAFIALIAACVILGAVGPVDLLPQIARLGLSCGGILYIITGIMSSPRLLQPFTLTLAALAVFLVSQFLIPDDGLIFNLRNFYGTLRVSEFKEASQGQIYTVHELQHGSTIHGSQVQEFPLDTEPTTYYTRVGPLNDIFSAYSPKSVGAVGLGAGAINCYTAPGRSFTYFELDPDVVAIAQKYFTFLNKCAGSIKPVFHVGDGRLELAKLKGEKFDLIVLDAFTSDAIPTHLLTQEAFALYFDRLAAGGVLAVHISNRYFQLWDTIAATAATLGLHTLRSSSGFSADAFYATPSIWTVAGAESDLAKLDSKKWNVVKPPAAIRPWSDDYSNLLDTLFQGNPPEAK